MVINKESNFTLLVDATVGYRDKLSKRLDFLYPLIENEKDIQKLYPKKVDGEDTEIYFASFHWTGKYSNLEREILHVSLDLASKDPDRITYCRHAKLGHVQTFGKAISLFQEKLRDPSSVFTTEVNAGLKDSGRKTDIYRYELTTSWEEKSFVRPKPFFWALDIASNVGNRKDIEGKIRSVAIKEGIPFAIMGAFYSGMLPKDIILLFQNPNFRKELKNQDKKSHIPNTTNNNFRDMKILNDIFNEVMDEGEEGWYPITNSNGYKTAIEIMKGAGWVKENDSDCLSFDKRKLEIKAKTVLLSIPEVAMQVVDQEYKDPDKSKHIYQNYVSRVTTKVITAYLIFKQRLPRYSNFSNKSN